MSVIIFYRDCPKCEKSLEDKFFDDGEDESCISCKKNKCQICAKRGQYNYENTEYGIRCSKDKLVDMIDLFTNDQAGKRFIKLIEKLGGKVLGEYKRSFTGVECECREGHKCNPCLSSVRQGNGMCKICARNDTETCEKNFRERIAEIGGKVLGEYRGANISIKCECRYGHQCNPSPSNVKKGGGICQICYGNDPEISEKNFRERIAEFGGKVLGKYRGSLIPIECECHEGHTCNPYPGSVRDGGGICNQCSQSGIEIFMSQVLKNLEISYKIETSSLRIKGRLRYDFEFEYNQKIFYLEIDGVQHFYFKPHWHIDKEGFEKCRQRDLVKMYAAKLEGYNLIRIAYTQIKDISIKDFSIYFLTLLYSDKLLIYDCPLYDDWVNRLPSTETIEKYLMTEERQNLS